MQFSSESSQFVEMNFCYSVPRVTSLWKSLLRKPCRQIHTAFREEFYCPLPPGHTFPMQKYPELFRILREENQLQDSHILVPEMISFEDLALVHTKNYLDKFIPPFSLTTTEVRKLGIPV